jgi:hypothetical protein
MKRFVFAALLAVMGCAHTDIAMNAGTSLARPLPPRATSALSSGASLQVNASGGAAAALAAGVVIAATVYDLRGPEPAPRYRRFSHWLWASPAPELDPTRTVSEEDCTKPIQGSGNLKCR